MGATGTGRGGSPGHGAADVSSAVGPGAGGSSKNLREKGLKAREPGALVDNSTTVTKMGATL